jgi:hypothetical protein
MDDTIPASSTAAAHSRPAWNKGKITGPKPPLRLGHVWAIRANLQLAKRMRDLAMFNLAIDSKLRGCDLVALNVGDVAPNGYAIDRANVRQKKTGRPVRFEPGSLSTTIFAAAASSRGSAYFRVVLARIGLWPRANMHASSLGGSAALASIHECSQRIPCAEPRRP